MGTFLGSALTQKNGFQTTEQILEWFAAQKKAYQFHVNLIPFSELDLWSFDSSTKDLVHKSGKFFQIQGLSVKSNVNGLQEWTQPILNQPEVGILGIITKVIGGTRYFLMQAKMEPGNINTLQLSPTVQATRSNYTLVHQGALPKYLEYFRDLTKNKVLVDQLQTECGASFFKKRNRNMLIEVESDVPVFEDFRWLTLGQIKELMLLPNFVNMNAKSVISSAMLMLEERELIGAPMGSFGRTVLESAFSDERSLYTIAEIMGWLAELKSKYEIRTRHLPLKDIGWEMSESEIYHRDKKFFSIVAVSVEAGSREITKWTQPLIKSQRIGTVGFLVKKINGVLHFLVQAMAEPGTIDVVELGPTVSAHEDANVPFIEYFQKPKPGSVKHTSVQSIEGGRFYHYQNQYMIVEIGPNEDIQIPENYKWMTWHQLLEFIRFTSSVHIEVRELLSCLPFVGTSAE